MTGNWANQAACTTADPALFFPTGNPGNAKYQANTRSAARICARCPVTTQCRAAANARNEHHGVWAGYDYGAGWNPTGTRRRTGTGPARQPRPRITKIELATC